jgi:hypothetical protein
VTTIRALAVCGVLSLFMLAASGARAQSDGIPTISGDWTGKITSVYWDQTADGPPHPKHKFKSKVDVAIDQKGGEILLTISFNDNSRWTPKPARLRWSSPARSATTT